MRNKEIIQNLYQNFSTGDVPAVLAAFAEDTPCVVRMAHIWSLADGKITKFLQHVDSANVLE